MTLYVVAYKLAYVTKRGRPSLYSQEIADAICDKIVNGETLRAICAQDGMPSPGTVTAWLRDREEFAAQYARAMAARTQAEASELVALADTATPETVNVVRLQVDTRKWVASKLLPKVYGEKQQVEHTGDGGGPIVIKTYAPRPDGDDQAGR